MFNKRLISLTLLVLLTALAFLPGMAQARPSADAPFTWGTGADGDLTIAAGNTYNIHTNNHPGRACSNGGDGVAYEVIGLTANTATLRSSPAAGCLKIGDEFALINMQGSNANTGNFELLRIQNLSANLVTFTTNKTKFYGKNGGDDSGLGSSQHVVLQRVPNYNNVTLNGNLVARAWNGILYGFVAFRVKGNWIGSGNINADALGYRGGQFATEGDNPPGAYQGESWAKLGIVSGSANDGGGGGRGAGQTGDCTGGQGNFAGGVVVSQICSSTDGATYGATSLPRIYLGSGAGGRNGGVGGKGGGIVYVMASNVNFLGTITTRGVSGQNSGGGSGGSIRIEGGTVRLGVLNSTGGTGVRNGRGGVGRIAIYYVNSRSWSSANPTPFTQKITSPPTISTTPTLTASLTPTLTPTKTWTPTQTPDFGATASSIALTLTAQGGPSLTPDLNGTATSISLTQTAQVNNPLTQTAQAATQTALAVSETPDFGLTLTAMWKTATALVETDTPTPDYNTTATADALTATAEHDATGTAAALTATAQVGTPDFNATGTALSLTSTAWASSPTPSITPTITTTPTLTLTATLSPTSSPSITPTTSNGNGGTPTSGGGGGNGNGATPTLTPGLPLMPSSGAACAITLQVYVYVDTNIDSMMAAQGEGVNSLQVNFLDVSFGKVGQVYTSNGKATFCVPDYLKGQTLRVDLPYLQRTGVMQAPEDNNKNQPLEMWFRLEPPTLPLFIP